MIAAPLALGLESRYGFRYAFVGTAVTGALWIPLWLAMTRGDRVPAEVSGTTEAAGGGASTPRGRAPEPPPREAPAPLPRDGWLGVVSSPPVLRAVVAIFGSAPALMFVLSWSSQYLVEEWHLARTDIGGYLVLPPLLFDVGAVGFGLLASARKSARAADDAPSTPRALLVAATALTSLLALAPLAPSPGAAMALFAAAACGGGGVYVLVTADTLARVPLDRTSSAGGMTAAAQSLAHIIAGPLVGGAVDRTHSYASALVVLGLAAVPTSLAFVLWPSMRKR
jgi:predicted MFS family arabinose efflux permease